MKAEEFVVRFEVRAELDGPITRHYALLIREGGGTYALGVLLLLGIAEMRRLLVASARAKATRSIRP